MLNRFRRRSRRRHGTDVDPLAIRDLLDDPRLRSVMEPVADPETDGPDIPVTDDWARLIALGPVRFDRLAAVGFDAGSPEPVRAGASGATTAGRGDGASPFERRHERGSRRIEEKSPRRMQRFHPSSDRGAAA